MINVRVIGTCSICGGRVVVPAIWHGIYPPIPTCESCGAVAKGSRPRVIPMEPREPPEPYKPWPKPQWPKWPKQPKWDSDYQGPYGYMPPNWGPYS